MQPDPLVRYVAQKTGIELSRGGLLIALDNYVDRRISELALAARSEYLRYLQEGDGTELERLIEIISVPHTWFFRDRAQIEAIRVVLQGFTPRDRALKIWIPACATGEDPYSLALLTREHGIQAEITASDLCVRSLDLARAARYGSFSLRELPEQYLRYFEKNQHDWIVSDEIKRSVRFQIHNLVNPPLPAGEGWDLILCRNVLIYFSADTAVGCAARLGQSLRATGVVAFGAGELIGQTPLGLSPVAVAGRIFFVRGATAPSVERRLSAGESTWSSATIKAKPVVSAASQTNLDPPLSPQEAVAAAASSLLAPGDPANIAGLVLKYSIANPLEPVLRMIGGIALYAAGDYARSQSELRAALLLNDRLWQAALYHGLCLESMGKPGLARTEYLHAARLLRTAAGAQSLLPSSLRSLEPDLIDLVRLKTRGPL